MKKLLPAMLPFISLAMAQGVAKESSQPNIKIIYADDMQFSRMKKNAVTPVELDIQSMIQPIPAKVTFMNNTAFTWCETRGALVPCADNVKINSPTIQ